MNALIIAKRELHAFFVSPIAYFTGAALLFVTGLFFFFEITMQDTASLGLVFKGAGTAFLFIVPFLTMHLLAKETQLGTWEILFSAPVQIWEVVAGKFIATFFFLTLILAPTLSYLLWLVYYGNEPNLPVIVSGYVGALALGAMLISLGLFASALTRSQAIAATLTLIISLLSWLLGTLETRLNSPISDILAYLSTQEHFFKFVFGLVSTSSIVYFLSITLAMLFLTTRILEMRR